MNETPEVAEHERIHFSAEKAVERLFRSANHRLVLVKRCVEHHWHAGQLAEAFDQAVIVPITFCGGGNTATSPGRSQKQWCC